MENQGNQSRKPELLDNSIKNQQVKSSKSSKEKIRENIFIKGITVIGLILVMLIPVPFILGLISERAERQQNTIKELGSQFGGNQTLYGPFIKIPYLQEYSNGDKTLAYTYISPNDLTVGGAVNPIYKKRGIYKVNLYHTNLSLKAKFNSDFYSQLDDGKKYIWDQAEMVFGVSEMNGLDEGVTFVINESPYQTKVGNTMTIEKEQDETRRYSGEEPSKTELVEELTVPISLLEKREMEISFPISLNGVGELNFIPISKKTNINISTNIKDIKFEGSFLPNSSDSLNKNRTIVWKVPSKGANQIWNNTSEFGKNKFGVQVLQSHDEYAKNNRVAKYAILFIGLTFVTFFFIEIINKLKIHPIQYVLVGMALCVFYLLLLSISEHIGFNNSYIISATATVLLICWFIKGIVKKTKIMGVVCTVLVLLYTYIFVIIQLDELALLSGSIGLFIILTLLMYFSRKIEWKTE